jgi:hypothetical protein
MALRLPWQTRARSPTGSVFQREREPAGGRPNAACAKRGTVAPLEQERTPDQLDTPDVKSRIASPILVLTCLAIVLPGCGGATPTDEQAVTDTVNAYHSAALAGDGRTACSYLTPAAQRLAAGRDLSGSPSASCARAIAHLHRDPRLSVNKDLSVTRVTVHGRKARAHGESPSKAAGFVDFELVKKGGQWKITYIFSTS